MAFSGSIFTFDGVSSDKFGLTITSSGSDGENDNPLISSVDFITQKSSQNPKFYQLGVEQSSPLTFQIEFFSDEPIYVYDREQIALWLSGNGQFKKLRIIQDDMTSIYYNCYFSKIDWTNIRNVGYGFKGTVVCDSPFAWKNQTKFVKTNEPTSGTEGNFHYPEQTKIVVVNTSTDYNLIMPNVQIALGDNNNKFKLTNLSNNNQWFAFDNLQNGEVVSITNSLCISSVTYPNKIVIDHFSGEFLELVRGKNQIVIDGQIKEIKFIYNQSKNVGG